MPTVRANGLNLHYEERGAGEPLLLLMGLGGHGALWEEHAHAYAAHFRCLLLDNRGAGRSDKPPGPYTIAAMADDALGLLDAIGVARAHVSGISMGGAIAQELALRAPERVQSLTVVSSWVKCDAYAARIFDMLRALAAAADPAAFTRLLQLWIFTPAYHTAHMDDLLRRERAGLAHPHPMPAFAFQAQCDACLAHDTRGRLARVAAPALVTAGDRDIFTPLAFSQELAASIPGADLRVFAGGGHAHHWEMREDFNRTTLAFMRRHRM